MRTSFATAVAASVGLVLAQTAVGQNADKKLGTVHFATSCNPEAQKLFDRGMLYQHSFWYRASQKEFEDVLKADPECGIAYWGVALSLCGIPTSQRLRKISPTALPRLPRQKRSAPKRSVSATTLTR